MEIIKEIDSLEDKLLPYSHDLEELINVIKSHNQYEWYYSIAKKIQPKNVLEIGVFCGTSILSMLLGCNSIEKMYLYDAGFYGADINNALSNIRNFGYDKEICEYRLDTQTLNSLDVNGIKFDLIHVDGDHTYKGALHDLELTLPLLSDNGVMVVDDLFHHPLEVAPAVDDFLAVHPELKSTRVDSFRGHIFIYRR